MDVITVPSPDCYERAPGDELGRAFAARSSRTWRRRSRGMRTRPAAVIVEPLVQCAGGMRMYDPVYLQLLREACDRHQRAPHRR